MKQSGFITRKIARIFDEIRGGEKLQLRNEREIKRLKRKISKLEKSNDKHESLIMLRHSQYDDLKYKARGEKCMITVDQLENVFFKR